MKDSEPELVEAILTFTQYVGGKGVDLTANLKFELFVAVLRIDWYIN